MSTATRRFQNISAILRELNQAGVKVQTVNDLLTVHVEEQPGQEFRHRGCGLLVATNGEGRFIPVTLVPPAAPHGQRGRGLRGRKTRCSPMDSLAVSHPHTDGRH